MSQQLTIQYGLKTFKVKTTPSMSLKDVLDKSVTHFKLDTSNNYGLMKGKQDLNLMIPMRLANLPQGCNLTLIEKNVSDSPSGSKGALVNVKVQVSDQTQPLILKIESTTTILELMRQLEKNSGLQLLNKSEIISKKVIGSKQSIRIDYKPILQIFTTIISSESDFNKTLSNYGISSGSVVIRLSYQKLSETLLSEETLDTEAEQEEILISEREDLNDMVDQEILEQKEKKYDQMEPVSRDDSVMALVGDEDQLKDFKTPKLYNPIRDQVAYEKDDDKSYEMSVDQAKLYHKLITNSGLNDRTRQKLNLNKKSPVVTFVSVRIKFPDFTILELSFNKDAKINEIYQELKVNYLTDPGLQFQLFQGYPHRLLDPTDDLILDLLGAKTVLLLQTDTTGNFLRSDIELSNLTYTADERDSGDEEIVQNDTSSMVNTAPESIGSQPKEKKVPKWFKIGKK